MNYGQYETERRLKSLSSKTGKYTSRLAFNIFKAFFILSLIHILWFPWNLTGAWNRSGIPDRPDPALIPSSIKSVSYTHLASSPIRPYASEYMVVPSPHINSFAITGAEVSTNRAIKVLCHPNIPLNPQARGSFFPYT